LRYQLGENTYDGFMTHTARSAEQALSLWYALDGNVQSIENEQRQQISLSDLRTAAEYEKGRKADQLLLGLPLEPPPGNKGAATWPKADRRGRWPRCLSG
jgi:hypothetical protein